MAPADAARPGARRVLLFLVALLLVWAPLQFLVWPRLQPWYSARVASAGALLLGLVERAERVTTLRPGGIAIHVHSSLSESAEPVVTVSADLLHFYGVLVASLVLVWPGLAFPRRAALLAAAAAGLFAYHVTVILIAVEHTYAVTLAEVSLRNYGDAERWFWEWLHDTTIFLAIPVVPALTLVLLFAASGFGETPARPHRGRTGPPESSSRRRVAAVLGTAVALALLTSACVAHAPRIAARQSERRCMLGYQALGLGDATGALARFDGALALNPRFADAHLGRGDALTALGRAGDAAAAYQTAIEAAPERALAHFKLGNSRLAAKDFEGATDAYREALTRDPNLREARINLAQTLGRMGRAAESETVLAEALGTNPDDREALLQLAAILIGGGRQCEALPHLLHLRALGPPAGREALVEESIAQLAATCPAGGARRGSG